MEKDENFVEQCQTMLRANSGMNLSQFWQFLLYILNESIETQTPPSLFWFSNPPLPAIFFWFCSDISDVNNYLETNNQSTTNTANVSVFNVHKILFTYSQMQKHELMVGIIAQDASLMQNVQQTIQKIKQHINS